MCAPSFFRESKWTDGQPARWLGDIGGSGTIFAIVIVVGARRKNRSASVQAFIGTGGRANASHVSNTPIMMTFYAGDFRPVHSRYLSGFNTARAKNGVVAPAQVSRRFAGGNDFILEGDGAPAPACPGREATVQDPGSRGKGASHRKDARAAMAMPPPEGRGSTHDQVPPSRRQSGPLLAVAASAASVLSEGRGRHDDRLHFDEAMAGTR